MELSLERRELLFKQPLATAYGVLHSRELIEVTLTGDDGRSGRGEAAPLEPYDGVSIERVLAALDSYRRALARAARARRHGAGCLPRGRRAAAGARGDRSRSLGSRRPPRRAAGLRAADDLAGAHGRRQREHRAEDPAAAAAAAAAAVAAGYSCVKLKVGVGDDEARVAAVRAAIGPQPRLRLDANGAWSVDEAERALAVLSRHGLELVEEPVSGLAATSELRARVPVRIAIDETAAQAGALTARVADAVCLKISRCAASAGCSPPRAWSARAAPTSTSPRPTTGRSASPRRCTRRRRSRRCRRAASQRSSCSTIPPGFASRTARSPYPPAPASASKGAERSRDGDRRLEREAVTGAAHDYQPRAGDRRRHPLGRLDIGAVALAGKDRGRHRKLPQPLPHRLEGGLPEGAQARGEGLWVAAALLGRDLVLDPLRVLCEQRHRTPVLNEGVRSSRARSTPPASRLRSCAPLAPPGPRCRRQWTRARAG